MKSFFLSFLARNLESSAGGAGAASAPPDGANARRQTKKQCAHLRAQYCALMGALVLLSSCAPLHSEDPPVIYVVQAPLCLLGCIVTLGSIREDVSNGSGGTNSLSQTATGGGGLAVGGQ